VVLGSRQLSVSDPTHGYFASGPIFLFPCLPFSKKRRLVGLGAPEYPESLSFCDTVGDEALPRAMFNARSCCRKKQVEWIDSPDRHLTRANRNDGASYRNAGLEGDWAR
jgi:hypothetical protein